MALNGGRNAKRKVSGGRPGRLVREEKRTVSLKIFRALVIYLPDELECPQANSNRCLHLERVSS